MKRYDSTSTLTALRTPESASSSARPKLFRACFEDIRAGDLRFPDRLDANAIAPHYILSEIIAVYLGARSQIR
jgi:hypothetical protein